MGFCQPITNHRRNGVEKGVVFWGVKRKETLRFAREWFANALSMRVGQNVKKLYISVPLARKPARNKGIVGT